MVCEALPATVSGMTGRHDILKQIDCDLLAVEEALNRRRQSLAEIDKKLSELQIPSSVGTANAGSPCVSAPLTPTPASAMAGGEMMVAGNPAPSCGSGLSSRTAAPNQTPVSGRTTKAGDTGGSFKDWLQEHKDFCAEMQRARQDQEGQERSWHQKRQQLQGQLYMLQSHLSNAATTNLDTACTPIARGRTPCIAGQAVGPMSGILGNMSEASTTVGSSLHVPPPAPRGQVSSHHLMRMSSGNMQTTSSVGAQVVLQPPSGAIHRSHSWSARASTPATPAATPGGTPCGSHKLPVGQYTARPATVRGQCPTGRVMTVGVVPAGSVSPSPRPQSAIRSRSLPPLSPWRMNTSRPPPVLSGNMLSRRGDPEVNSARSSARSIPASHRSLQRQRSVSSARERAPSATRSQSVPPVLQPPPSASSSPLPPATSARPGSQCCVPCLSSGHSQNKALFTPGHPLMSDRTASSTTRSQVVTAPPDSDRPVASPVRTRIQRASGSAGIPAVMQGGRSASPTRSRLGGPATPVPSSPAPSLLQLPAFSPAQQAMSPQAKPPLGLLAAASTPVLPNSSAFSSSPSVPSPLQSLPTLSAASPLVRPPAVLPLIGPGNQPFVFFKEDADGQLPRPDQLRPPASVGSPPASIGVAPGSLGLPPGSVGPPPGSMGPLPGSVGLPPGSLGPHPGSVGLPPGSVGLPPGSMGPPPGSVGQPPGPPPGPPPVQVGPPPGPMGPPAGPTSPQPGSMGLPPGPPPASLSPPPPHLRGPPQSFQASSIASFDMGYAPRHGSFEMPSMDQSPMPMQSKMPLHPQLPTVESMQRCASMEYPLPPMPPPCQGGCQGEQVGVPSRLSYATTPPPPPPPPPQRDAGVYDFPVMARVPSMASSAYPQSFSEVNVGSFAEGLEQWRPPKSMGSFQARTEAAFAPVACQGLGGPNATYNGPQPLPRGQPQCPVQ